MGAGKTTVGRRLARRLNWKLVDLDREIEREEGRSVPSIFRENGEAHFRDLERRYLRVVSSMENAVIALGGGTFADAENRAVAENTGLTIWLKVSFAGAASRVKIDGSRPMFANRDQAQKLLQARESHYAAAKVHISTDDKNVNAVADEILGVIGTL